MASSSTLNRILICLASLLVMTTLGHSATYTEVPRGEMTFSGNIRIGDSKMDDPIADNLSGVVSNNIKWFPAANVNGGVWKYVQGTASDPRRGSLIQFDRGNIWFTNFDPGVAGAEATQKIRMFIKDDGKVAIGENFLEPAHQLDVNGVVHASDYLTDTPYPNVDPQAALTGLCNVNGQYDDLKKCFKLNHMSLPPEMRRTFEYDLRVIGDRKAFDDKVRVIDAEKLGEIRTEKMIRGNFSEEVTVGRVRVQNMSLVDSFFFAQKAIKALSDNQLKLSINVNALKGKDNSVNSADSSTVGGSMNMVEGSKSAAIGGELNKINSNGAVTVGGSLNTVSGMNSVVIGSNNDVDAENCFVGGFNNHILSSANNSFVWGVSATTSTVTVPNSFMIYPGGEQGGVTIGSNNPEPGARLTVAGGDIRVSDGGIYVDGKNMNVPDHVFEDSYDLKSMEEVREYVSVNKHLPNVPSRESIRKNGVEVSKFQMKLLEKIEELTLYSLQQEARVKKLEAEIEALKNKK